MSSPLDVLTLLNSLPEISIGVIGVFTTHLHGFAVGELLLAMLGDEVIFDVDELSICIDPFKGVAAVAMVEAPSLGRSVITEEHKSGVIGLWGVGE